MPIIYDPPGYAPTLGDVVGEIIETMQGFAAAPDQITSLTAGITDTDLTFTVADPEQGLGAGIVEVDDELMWVESVDMDTRTVTVHPRGRGWRNTPAAAHTAGAAVIASPLVPRHRVVKAVNDTINGLYPSLYGVVATEFTQNSPYRESWVVPAGAEAVLDVSFKDTLGNWQRVRGWEPDFASNTTDFASGVSLRITSCVPDGRTVRVLYSTRLTPLTNTEAPITDSGLQASAKDLVVYGALSRLAPVIDVGKLSPQSATADALDGPRPIGTAMALAREFKKEFKDKLAEEVHALKSRYRTRQHFTR